MTSCRLIVNADDFGLTPGINRAVEELHHAGAITSATLMANGPAFLEAARIARCNPNLGVGCHVVLVDGTPVSNPVDIPTLLGPHRRDLRPTLPDFSQAVLRGTIRPDDLLREAIAQVRKIQAEGIPITHLDSHKHTHLIPAVATALLQAAEECGVPALRNPFEPSATFALGHGGKLRRLQMRLLDRSFRQSFLEASHAVRRPDGTLGISTTGELTRHTLGELLASLPAAGTWELATHPGYDDDALAATPTRLRASRDRERIALLACIPTLSMNPHAPALIHYGAL